MGRSGFSDGFFNSAESISTTINELATRQQRLIGYRQCLIDMKESNNATPKNPGSS